MSTIAIPAGYMTSKQVAATLGLSVTAATSSCAYRVKAGKLPPPILYKKRRLWKASDVMDAIERESKFVDGLGFAKLLGVKPQIFYCRKFQGRIIRPSKVVNGRPFWSIERATAFAERDKLSRPLALPKTQKGRKTLCAHLPEELHAEFRDECQRVGVTQSYALYIAMNDWLAKMKKY